MVTTGSGEALRVLVTGGSSGIGAATVRRFVASGARVAALSRGAGLHQAVTQGGVTPIVCDVTDSSAVTAAVDTCVEVLGGLDVVVNAAGVAEPRSLLDCDDASWSKHVDVNLSGTFFVCRAAAPALLSNPGGGSIVNVASELSSVGMTDLVAYCAAKAGVIGLTKALAVELAPRVRVNAVCPGPVDTPMLRREFELSRDAHAGPETAVERVPLQRLGEAVEIAETVFFLAVSAPFATGAAWALDGGTTAL